MNKNKNDWNRNKNTFESCLENAKKYNTKSEWFKNHSGSYQAAHRNGWLDKCCEHMKPMEFGRKKTDSLEKCLEIAKKYKTRNDWNKNDHKSYRNAHRNGWLDQCCSHMEIKRRTQTLEKCVQAAYNYKTRDLFNK